MCEMYKHFVKDWEHLFDFSEEMMLEMFHAESHGTPISENNGYYHGKKWMNVTVAMWKEDMESGILFKCELYDDPNYPHWFLDRILK